MEQQALNSDKLVSIIKIGGNIIDDELALDAFLDDIASFSGDVVLVHGGGKVATSLAQRLDIPVEMVEGRRITNAAMLEVVQMVYGGLINKNIVARLAARRKPAIGLTGADAACITADKRPPRNGLDFGFVGDITSVNADVFLRFVAMKLVPVVAPLSLDIAGQMLNTNADTMASAIAAALAPLVHTRLFYCFEKRGLLANPDDDNSVLPSITEAEALQLTQKGIISKGMLPKLSNAFAALNSGVAPVQILHASELLPALHGEHKGTLVAP